MKWANVVVNGAGMCHDDPSTLVFVYANDSLGQLEGSKTGVLEPGSYQLVTTAAYHNITGVRGPDEGISTAIVTLTFSPVTP